MRRFSLDALCTIHADMDSVVVKANTGKEMIPMTNGVKGSGTQVAVPERADKQSNTRPEGKAAVHAPRRDAAWRWCLLHMQDTVSRITTSPEPTQTRDVARTHKNNNHITDSRVQGDGRPTYSGSVGTTYD